MSDKTSKFGTYLDWLETNKHFARLKKKGVKIPQHPGQVLLKDYLQPRGITQQALSSEIGCTYAKVSEIIHGKRGITAAFALDLERVLGLPAETWLSLQLQFDLWEARNRQKTK